MLLRRTLIALAAAATLASTAQAQTANPRVVKDPAPFFGTALLADSAINLAIKPWVKIADYVAAQAEINKAVVERFRDAGIEIPFPQREVRLVNAPPPEPGRRAA